MITVIVPVYNAERYLQECLQSIVSQTYDDLQIILIDDGSTDNSLSVAREMATRDTRISVLEQAHKGQSAARNAGLEQAKGEYLSFVDADDYIASDYYETLIGNIGDNDVLQIGFKRVSDKGVVLRTVLPRGFYRLTSMCCRLIRREFLMKVRYMKMY